MSLNWNLTKVKDHEKLCWIASEHARPENGIKKGDVVMHPTTNALIWSAMMIDLGSITEKNADEWHWRLSRMAEAGVSGFNRGKEQWVPTLAEIKAHTGLWTNVYPNKTRRQFEAKLARMVSYKGERAETSKATSKEGKA